MKFQYFSSGSTKISQFFRKCSDRGREAQTTYPTLDSSPGIQLQLKSNFKNEHSNPAIRWFFFAGRASDFLCDFSKVHAKTYLYDFLDTI